MVTAPIVPEITPFAPLLLTNTEKPVAVSRLATADSRVISLRMSFFQPSNPPATGKGSLAIGTKCSSIVVLISSVGTSAPVANTRSLSGAMG